MDGDYKLRKFLLLASLFVAPAVFAQSTTVSGTITDGTQAFVNGTYTVQFYSAGLAPPFNWNGSPFTPQVYSGTLNGSGAFSGLSLPSNNLIAPAGTQWAFTVCPASTTPCTTTNISVTGSTLSVSSLISPPPISVRAQAYQYASAYRDGEITGPYVGFSYFNLTDNTIHVCTVSIPCTWVSVGSGGGGGATLQTNGTNNLSQSLLNFTNPSSFNGLSFTFSNPSGGVETFGLTGTLNNAGLTNSSITINAPSFQTGWGSVSLGGSLSPSWSSETANTFLAAPNGSAGSPTFRAMVAADVPTLNQNTTGTAGGLTGCTVATAGAVCYWNGSSWAGLAGNNSGTLYLAENASGVPSWSSSSSSGVTSVTGDGTLISNSTSTGAVTLTLGTAGAHKWWGNNTGSTAAPGYESLTTSDLPTGIPNANLANSSVTINTASPLAGGGSVSLGGTLNLTCSGCSSGGVTFQTNGTNNSSQTGLNFLNSTTNSVGLMVTASNPSTTGERFEVTGANYTGNAATATALAATPSQCSGVQFSTGVAASGNANCASIIAGDVPTLNQNTTGTAGGLTGCTTSTAGAICYWNGSSWAGLAGNNSGTLYLAENASGVPSWTASSTAGVTSFSGDGTFATNSSSTGAVTLTLSTVGAHKYWGNNTGSTAAGSYDSIVNGDLPGSGAVTINTSSPLGGGGSLSLGGSLTLTCSTCASSTTFQTNGTNNASQSGLNFLTSTSNSIGGTITPSNPSTTGERFELTGTINSTGGGTGVSNPTAHDVPIAEGSSAFTFISPNTSGYCLLSNGTSSDPSFQSCPSGFTNPMTTLGDMIVENSVPAPARLGGPTSVNSVPQILISTPSSGAATLPAWSPAGVLPNPQTGTTYTYLATDRAGYASFSNGSAIAVTLPQAGGTGFASNWVNVSCDIGAGTATITPTTSTISYSSGTGYTSGASSMALTTGQCAFIYSDNTNYFAIQFTGGGSGSGTISSCSSASSHPLSNYTASTTIGCSVDDVDSSGNITIPNSLSTDTVTAGDIVCMTATAQVGNCTGTSPTNFIGVFANSNGGVQQGGPVNVNLDGTPTVVFGDIICASTVTPGKGHDNGGSACSLGQQVGIVTTSASTVSTANVFLKMQ